jgi:hypothetical protein
MVNGLSFIPTQGAQLWLSKRGHSYGTPGRPYRLPAERWASAEWLDPLSCWVDFSDIIAEERWSRDVPGTLAYFCGPLVIPDGVPEPGPPEHAGFQHHATAVAEKHVERMLERLDALLPRRDQAGAWRDEIVGNYGRANVLPTERYGISYPGHLHHRRLAWESGYENLVLAGDWTFTGLNINSFEGATTSGALASHAVTGTPALDDIIGLQFLRRVEPPG